MTFRMPAVLAACAALLAGLFVAAPAQAAGTAKVSWGVIVLDSKGYGKVNVTCRSKSTCSGYVWISGADKYRLKYKVKGRASAYVKVRYPSSVSGGLGSGRHVTLNVGSYRRAVVVEYKKRGVISGKVSKVGGTSAKNIKVELWKPGRGGQSTLVSSRSVNSAGQYSFSVTLGTNNAPSAKYQLQIVGTDPSSGVRRTWWWRGTSGSFHGGARHSREATTLKAGRTTYTANFAYGAIKGKVTRGSAAVSSADVVVAARPLWWPRSSRDMRELDFMSCANIFGTDVTDSAGNYEVGFLPVYGSRKMYLVKADGAFWNDTYGTCHAAVNYRRNAKSTPTALALTGTTVKNLDTARKGRSVTVVSKGYSGLSSSASVDRWVTVREYAPGRPILSSDVIRATSLKSNSTATFSLAAGKYWVEVGRRTGCAKWYRSRYANNDGYFNGLDRSFEKWKAKNYKMYREHCRAYSAGTYKLVSVSGNGGSQSVSLTNRKGGWVSGRVSNVKIKPRTELMVRLTSSDGKRVYRTALTDGAGRFKVTGLSSGTYKVVVNADSWRGISRTFKGKHTVKVKTGKGTSVGTLAFKQ